LGSDQAKFDEAVADHAKTLVATRPTAVNLEFAVNRSTFQDPTLALNHLGLRFGVLRVHLGLRFGVLRVESFGLEVWGFARSFGLEVWGFAR
jgi:hypothetical protein